MLCCQSQTPEGTNHQAVSSHQASLKQQKEARNRLISLQQWQKLMSTEIYSNVYS